MSSRPLILPVLATDLEAIERIAAICFPVPWTRAEFEKELKRSYSLMRVLRPSLHEPVCAFANYWHVADELQVMNIATLPAARRLGHGSALLLDLIQTGRERRARSVTLEVRRSNDAARALYRKFGFEEQGIRQHYYSDNGEDAVVMHLTL
ncbi:MAG: ribosomal protein S18-alanine N-acetyltransferase [Polyangiales bacterium]